MTFKKEPDVILWASLWTSASKQECNKWSQSADRMFVGNCGTIREMCCLLHEIIFLSVWRTSVHIWSRLFTSDEDQSRPVYTDNTRNNTLLALLHLLHCKLIWTSLTWAGRRDSGKCRTWVTGAEAERGREVTEKMKTSINCDQSERVESQTAETHQDRFLWEWLRPTSQH